jgi:septal ring factor EnvC (AmiA/AmiB activator)
LSAPAAETAAAVINHKNKKIRKQRKKMTKTRKKVSGSQIPIQPRLQHTMPFSTPQPYVPYYYHWPTLPAIQYQQNELRLELKRCKEQIAQLGANIKKMDEDIREKDKHISKLAEHQAKHDATMAELQVKLGKSEERNIIVLVHMLHPPPIGPIPAQG